MSYIIYQIYALLMIPKKKENFINTILYNRIANLQTTAVYWYVNPSVPDAPNFCISAFEKRLSETERSKNVVDSFKTSCGVFYIIN